MTARAWPAHRRRGDHRPPRAGQAAQPRSRAAREPGRRRHRHRPHPLGHPRRADGAQRPPSPRRPGGGGPQRHHRELRRAEGGAAGAGPHLPQRHRHRGRRPPDRPRAGEGAAAGRLQDDAGPAPRRLRPGGDDRGRGGADPGRAARAARWWWAMARARCSWAATRWRSAPSPTASPIWRTGTTSPSPAPTSASSTRPARRPSGRCGGAGLRGAGGEGRVPALHGEGDPRAAGRLPAHPVRLSRPRGGRRPTPRTASTSTAWSGCRSWPAAPPTTPA